MKMRQGISFIEVIISFLLISFLVIIVSGLVTSSYAFSTQVKDLPSIYLQAQGEVENKLEQLKDAIKSKFRIENEIKNIPADKVPQNLKDELKTINEKLEELKREQKLFSDEVEVFGTKVEVFEFDHQYSNQVGGTRFYAGAANVEPIDRPVPIIDKVEIKAKNSLNEVYDPNSDTVIGTVVYNSKNKEYLQKTFYQWYVAVDNFHTTPYKNLTSAELEKLGNKLLAEYPQSFTILPGEKNATLTIKPEYEGKFLILEARPLSSAGKMGRSVTSNLIYVSKLPKLTTGTYTMLIDPSITYYDYVTTATSLTDESIRKKEISEIQSRKDLSSKLVKINGGNVVINLDGEPTNSHTDQGGNDSRVIMFEGDGKLKAEGITENSDTKILLVAKDANDANSEQMADLVFFDSVGASLSAVKGQSGDTGWKVWKGENLSGEITLGKDGAKVAEVILVDKASDDEINKITDYLAEKYHIQD